MAFETLHEATKRYRLRDPNMNNAAIANQLGAVDGGGDHNSSLVCCFFRSGAIAAIRTQKDEVVIFHLFESVQMKMQDIGDRIE